MELNEILQKALGGEIDENKVLYEHYLGRLNRILQVKETLDLLEKNVRLKIAKYSGGIERADSTVQAVLNRPDLNGYPIRGPWVDKIEYVLRKEDRPLTARQVLTFIEDMQPELKGKIASSVYPTLSDNSKDGKKFIKLYDKVLKVNIFQIRQ
ncbi:MAG: hypothetical protein JSS09_08820 [Verrucomicrobia bacterium]|nr:hypothetical protein [Verrucomicrobiota bacterium]